MYQITKMKDNKVLWIGKSQNPRRQLSQELENTHLTLRPNWKELSNTQGVYFDTMDGFTFWVHKL